MAWMEGPWQIFDGLIIWFISPGGEPLGRLSGLFDYAILLPHGYRAYGHFVWHPFSSFYSWKKPCDSMCFLIAFIAGMILTDSRNAWGAIFLALPLVFGSASWVS